MRHRDRLVHTRSMGSLGCALGVVRFIRVEGSLGCTLGCVCFIRIHWGAPLGCVVHPVSLGSLGSVLGVVGFVRCRWIHWGTTWKSYSFAGIIGARPGNRQVHPALLGSFGYAAENLGFIREFILGLWIHWCAPWGHRVHLGTLGSLGYASWFIRVRWVHWGAPWGSLGSSWVIGVRTGDR